MLGIFCGLIAVVVLWAVAYFVLIPAYIVFQISRIMY